MIYQANSNVNWYYKFPSSGAYKYNNWIEEKKTWMKILLINMQFCENEYNSCTGDIN